MTEQLSKWNSRGLASLAVLGAYVATQDPSTAVVAILSGLVGLSIVCWTASDIWGKRGA